MIDSESRCRLFEHHKFSAIPVSIREDIIRFATFSPEYRPNINLKTMISIFFKQPILCVLCYRVSHYLYIRRWIRLARYVATFNFLLHKAHLPAQSCIGPGFFLAHCPGSTFHGTAGRNLTMFSLAICCPWEDGFADSALQGPQLGDGVTVGGHAVLIGRIVVGDNVKVAPLTRLAVNCPSNTVVVSARVRPSVVSHK